MASGAVEAGDDAVVVSFEAQHQIGRQRVAVVDGVVFDSSGVGECLLHGVMQAIDDWLLLGGNSDQVVG